MDWCLAPRSMPEIPTAVLSQIDFGLLASGGRAPPAVFIPWIAMHVNGNQSCWCAFNFAILDGDAQSFKDSQWECLRLYMQDAFEKILREVARHHRMVMQAATAYVVRRERHKLDHEDIGKDRWFAKHCGTDRDAICIRRSLEGAGVCKLYYGMGTPQDRPDVLGCVTLFNDFSILASMLAVIRLHVCDAIFGNLEIVIRNEVPANCNTPFPMILNSLHTELGRFGLQHVKRCVFADS